MDQETASLIDDLRHPGAALLLGLLEADRTEDELRECAPDLSQSAVNRKLRRLAGRGLIYREPGAKQQKGLMWGLVFRDETDDLVAAANALAQRSVQRREEQVAETAARLKRSRAHRRLRDVNAVQQELRVDSASPRAGIGD
jgi:DNA-binding HxlR family transcriptional regulator